MTARDAVAALSMLALLGIVAGWWQAAAFLGFAAGAAAYALWPDGPHADARRRNR